MNDLPESNDAKNYPGVLPFEKISREIRKPNGDLITIFDSGSTVVHLVGKAPKTWTAEGRVWTLAEGQPIDKTPKRKLPLAQRPLNVSSNGTEEIARKLSNFEERRFVLDGKNYHSVEGWYQGLKWPDAKKRAEIAKLSGAQAKKAGKGAPKQSQFIYQGKEISFGSPEHHQLVKAAIRASLEQSPEVAKAFLLTHPRPLEHNTGRKENPSTALPGSKFAQILEEIRAELIASR